MKPLRQALIHAAETIAPNAVAPDRVRISHRAGDEPLAWLLGGWLSSRLGNGSKADVQIHVEENARDGEVLTVSFDALTASMNRQRVVVEASAGIPPVRLPVRHESDADAVATELGTLSHDVCLRDALAALTRHFREMTK
ncbi:MAG: glucose-6-phosphate dehydrogenase assembly protein OpcA [Acidobacteria bacterium]|nr:glucose-6-phosphate dehydrogenase assembly protein OpcA [Acidobacteriota bacterium]